MQRADAHRAVDALLDQVDGAVAGAQRQLQPRMAAQQARQRRRHQAARDAAGHVDDEPPGNLALALLEQVVDVLDLGQQRPQALQQLGAVGGQAHLARGPVQQPRAQLGLQLLDCGRDGSARQLQRIGGLDETAHLRHLREDAVLFESVHAPPAGARARGTAPPMTA